MVVLQNKRAKAITLQFQAEIPNALVYTIPMRC